MNWVLDADTVANPGFATASKVSKLKPFLPLPPFLPFLPQLSVHRLRWDTSFTYTLFPEIAGCVQVSVVDTS